MGETKPTVIDLFCGVGGFSRGFERAGFSVKLGVDIVDEFLNNFNKNHSGAKTLKCDIRKEVPDSVKRIKPDVVIGSPPCQGFSDARGERCLEDDRNTLVFDFIRWVSEIRPKVVLMENVAGFLTISEDFIREVEEKYRSIGYDIDTQLLNAADFGVPQMRKRVFCFAVRDNGKVKLSPKITHSNLTTLDNSVEKCTTVGEALSGLPQPTNDGIVSVERAITKKGSYASFVFDSGVTHNHIAKYPSKKELDVISRIPEGKMYRSNRFGKKYIAVWELFKDEFTEREKNILKFIGRHEGRNGLKIGIREVGFFTSGTILSHTDAKEEDLKNLLERDWLRTKMFGKEMGYALNTNSGVRPMYMRLNRTDISNTIVTHDFSPRQKLHPIEDRGLSLREGARIQSFPDSFIFEGNFDDISKMIGNAVAPLVSMRVAEFIKKSWFA